LLAQREKEREFVALRDADRGRVAELEGALAHELERVVELEGALKEAKERALELEKVFEKNEKKMRLLDKDLFLKL
jgi:hypothetical protein